MVVAINTVGISRIVIVVNLGVVIVGVIKKNMVHSYLDQNVIHTEMSQPFPMKCLSCEEPSFEETLCGDCLKCLNKCCYCNYGDADFLDFGDDDLVC